jgi:hypothetical protein
MEVSMGDSMVVSMGDASIEASGSAVGAEFEQAARPKVEMAASERRASEPFLVIVRITSLLISRPVGRSRIRCGSLRHSEALPGRIGKVRNKFWGVAIAGFESLHMGAPPRPGM